MYLIMPKPVIWTVNRIVGDGHGGEIEFEFRVGETRFKVRLPFHREPPGVPG